MYSWTSAHCKPTASRCRGATSLLQAKGNLGLIATNTVAQGDSREVGLDAMVASGFTITRSIQSRKWPASSANLEYAAVWGTNEVISDEVPRVSDEATVRRISTLLEPAGRVDGNPSRLEENAGIAFQGCIVLGMGFVVDPAEAQEWIAADARNAEVLFPYLNGEDLNSRPDTSASRWVIDFNDWNESRAATYELPFGRLRERVKPERQRLKPDGSYSLRRPLPDRWWQYAEKRPAMRRAIADLPEVLVLSRVSKTVMPLRVSTRQVINERCAIFATSSFADQAVLSSDAHFLWGVKYSSTLESRVTYAPSDAFETFPRPIPTEGLERVGATLDRERRAIMVRQNVGLTKLYNRVADSTDLDDPDIERLRAIHVELDLEVMAAYGWDDLHLAHGFHAYRQMERWMVDPAAQTEILDRLLEENHRRAKTAAQSGVRSGTRSALNQSGTLFE